MPRDKNLIGTEKCQMLMHVRYEIQGFFLSPLPDTHPLMKENEQLRESVMMRRVVHCRALIDFFYKRNLAGDDLGAECHYGYVCRNSVKNVDKKRFNKDIFLLFYSVVFYSL